MKSLLSATALLAGVVAGSTTIKRAEPTGPKPSTTSTPPNVVDIDGDRLTAYYSGFTVEASDTTVTVLPTAPAVKVGTDTVSLGSAGDLAIDKSTTSLVKTLSAPVPNTIDINSHTYIAYYSGFVINPPSGTPVTVLPTASAVTVGTERVSLGTDGHLVLGSSTTSLLKSLPTTSTTKKTSTDTSKTTTSKSSTSTSKSSTSTSKSSTSTSKKTTTTSKSSVAPITTYSAYPTGFTATKVTTGVTTDGHTSTSKGGHVTIIPVIGGLSCWFCPHGSGSGGIQLPGLPFPGVFPPPPGPPGFSISANAPSITIGSDGDPTYSSEPTSKPTSSPSKTTSTTKTSSSSCTKSVTASICTSSLIYEKSGSSITATSTTSKCQTTVACSAKDSTTTVKTTTSSTGTSSCVSFPVPSIIPEQADEDDDDTGAEPDTSAPSKRSQIVKGYRSFIQRDQSDALQKRVTPVAYRGPPQCGWGNPVPGLFDTKVAIKAPNYPAANLLNDYTPTSKVKGNAYLWLVTKAGEGADSCDGLPWTYTQVSDSALKSTKNAVGQTYNYNSNGATGALVNPDHVYEIKLLKYFINSNAPDSSSDAAACNNWLKFWIAEKNAESTSYGNIFAGPANPLSRMATLFKLLPGTANPAWSDFVGMDKDVNGMKGALLDPGIPDITSSMSGNTPEEWIQVLNLMGLAQKMLKDDNVASRFATTNARIYGAFQQMDGITGDCAPPTNNYASSYSSWIGNYLQTQGAQVQSVYKSIVETALPPSKLTSTLTDSEGKSTGENTFLADKLTAVTNAFPVESMTYDTAQLLTFAAAPPAGQAITIKKRDSASSSGAVPAACAFTTSGSSTTTSKSTTKTSSSTTKTSSSSSKSTSSPSVTSHKSSSTSKSSSGSYTVTITTGYPEPSPYVACDFSANSCAHVACSIANTTAQCTEDDGTGGGMCQCLGTVS